jgi:RNA polymerase sigma-70 factor (ECF subfamily)
MTEQTDERRLAGLMARWQNGETAAFDEIYASTAGALAGYLGRWFGAAAAADLVQETYLRVVEARSTFRAEMPFRPWLFAIARHVALDAYRRRKRTTTREVAVEAGAALAVEPPAEDHVDGTRLVERLRRLPASQNEVLWLARVEGMTSVEIGRIVGATPAAVKVRLHRATAKLKAMLAGSEP